MELLNAANGLRPLSGSGYSTVLAFWLGWPTSEVPGVYLGASVLDALRRGRRGDFGGLKGKAALALTAAAWVILAVIRYRGATTPGPVLEAGLTEQLGPDYAKELATLPTEPMRSRGRNLPLRTAMARRRYVETTNVVCYGPYGRANLPTSGAAATCHATPRHRCWYRCPAAPGYWGGAARRRIR